MEVMDQHIQGWRRLVPTASAPSWASLQVFSRAFLTIGAVINSRLSLVTHHPLDDLTHSSSWVSLLPVPIKPGGSHSVCPVGTRAPAIYWGFATLIGTFSTGESERLLLFLSSSQAGLPGSSSSGTWGRLLLCCEDFLLEEQGIIESGNGLGWEAPWDHPVPTSCCGICSASPVVAALVPAEQGVPHY